MPEYYGSDDGARRGRRLGLSLLAVVLALVTVGGVLFGAAMYREDVNGDGVMDIRDAVSLLLLGRANPADPRADYNGDNVWSINDVTDLIANIQSDSLTPISTLAPKLALSVDSLSFGEVGLDVALSLYFEIYNQGDTTLVVSSILPGDTVFTVSPAAVSVAPSDSAMVEVTFSPTAVGEFSTTLSVMSNDPANGSVAVALSGAGMDSSAGNRTWIITMPGNAFSPDTLTIAVGDTVTWSNTDVMAHTATSGPNGTADNIWNSGNMNPGDTFTYVFNQTGDFSYYCIYHYAAGMYGLIKVE